MLWAVCGCMRVCDTSLEPPRPPYERLIGRIRFARTGRPQCAKMCFLLHKALLNDRFFIIIDNPKNDCHMICPREPARAACLGPHSPYERMIGIICLALAARPQ